MTFNIQDFVANIQEGFQKPNRYRVRLPIPLIMASQAQYSMAFSQPITSLEFFADSADLIDIAFGTHSIVRYGYGASEKKPFAPLFNDITITFYNDSLSTNLGFFQNWMNLVQGFNMSQGIVSQTGGGAGGAVNTQNQAYEINYKDDYAVDGQITLIDNNANDVITWRMRRMWPMHIANTKLGWAIVNDIMRVVVTFNFMDWYVDKSAGGTLLDQYQGITAPGQQGSGGYNSSTAASDYLNLLNNNGPSAGGATGPRAPPTGTITIGAPEDGGITATQ